MLTPCIGASAMSHGDHLLVTSYDEFPDDKVNVMVYNGHYWASAQHLAHPLYVIKSTVFNGRLHLMGVELPILSQKTYVYSASLDSLLASCQPSETSQPSSVWKRLTDVRSGFCYPAVFGNRLVTVGVGSPSTTTTLLAFSSFTQAWVHMKVTPVLSSSGVFPCAVVLPSNELMVVRGEVVFKVTLRMTPFDPENSFNMGAVSLLEAAAGIPVMSTLNSYTPRIKIFLGLVHYTDLDLNGLLKYWISNVRWVPPTWKNVLLIIRLLNLDDLAQRMETFLSGETEKNPMEEATEEEESGAVESQLQLRDQTIYHLKQELASLREEKDATIFTLQEKIKEQISENEELRSQVQIKQEDVEEKPVGLLPVKTEPKEELLTLEGELFSLLPVKTEVKEEAVTMTKAETTSTTATWNLRGVEVCGEMTVVVYSSHDQQITWPGYGLRLHIPKGCLPEGMEQCTINIKASLAGQYEFPENSHLISAIFWFHCEGAQKFTRPITVEIQHCAKLHNITNFKLSFARAVCSQKQLPYTFKQLPGGNFTSHSSYGVIELNSFSGVGVTQEGSEDREYCSQLFYLGQPSLCKIHYVVTWNIEVHLTVVKDKYVKNGAVLGLYQLVDFESDEVTLDIPLEGISIKGWKITPLMRPVVTKKQVDNFKEGKVTPCCQLKAEFELPELEVPGRTRTLKHQVTLQGAKYPYNIFTIDLPPEVPNSQPAQTFGDLATAGPPPTKRKRLETSILISASSSNQGPSYGDNNYGILHTTIPELKVLLRELRKVANEWEDIGIELDIEEGQLKQIKSDHTGDSKACLREMLRVWLSRVAPPPSWSAMADTLDTLGYQDIATHLRSSYCQ